MSVVVELAVEMVGIDKTFPGVVANHGVDSSARWGEVHALLGENGAGKSTLMSILAGLYRPDAGHIRIAGQPVVFHSPRAAIEHGVGMVYQHYRLVPSQTVAENLLLGLPGVPFRLHGGTFIKQANELGERYHLHVEPWRPVWQLSVGEQQRVEILKTLHRGARILILDEPTAVLTPRESEDLMQTLRRIATEGRTVILISHKLEEIRSVAQRVSVLRGGAAVASGVPMGEMSARDLATLMVGEQTRTPVLEVRASPSQGSIRLSVAGVHALDERGLPALRGVSLTVHAGEVLGIAGVAGNGQRQLAHVIAGLQPASHGQVVLDGRDLTVASPRARARSGVAHIPEDRLGEGLVGNLPVSDNAIMRVYDRPVVARGPILDPRRILSFTRSLLERFSIRALPESITRLLSGGQLQRLLLAREMALEPRLIIAVHPTRGLDVAATEQVQAWLLATAHASGTGVLLISEDLDEILELSDRISVMYEGQIVGTLQRDAADRATLGLMMAGSHPAAERA